MTSKNDKQNSGVGIPVSSQSDNKRAISASNGRFARGDWGEF